MALPPDLWITEVSTSFPTVTFRLLTGVPRAEGATELGEVVGEGSRRAAESIRSHPDVVAYDSLFESEARTLAQYQSTETGLYEFLGESSVPPEFPVVVEDGFMEFDLTATRAQFEAVGDALDGSGRAYDLLSVTGGEPPEDLLTDRQRECLNAALREGYLEVPRRCTLADLASTLGVDKSTASETLRRGQARVLKWFLAGRR
jgi:predicted DNA binding protein